jgi:hypothetical protein
MVTEEIKKNTTKRNDTAVRISKWLDQEVENFIANRRVRIDFPSKRNFVDLAVMRLLEERGVNLDK